MNQTNSDNHEVKKQGFFRRVGTAVSEAFLAWLCQCEMGMSPHESQLFMHHYGFGCEEAAYYHYVANTKYDEREV